MALVHYPGCKVSALAFVNDSKESDEHKFVAGSCDQPSNNLHLYSISQSSRMSLMHEQDFEGNVCAILSLKNNLIATASSLGTVAFYFVEGGELKNISARQVSDGILSSLVAPAGLNAVLSADEDGTIACSPLDKLTAPIVSKQVSQTPITCMDALPASDVLFGNTAGCVKVLDIRLLNAVATMSNSFCPVTAVRRNPSNPHLFASGTQTGNLCLWDLRKGDAALLQLAAHTSCITGLQYKEDESNVILSSALDGKVIKWNLLPTCEVTAAEAIASPQSLSGPAINCFDLHHRFNEIAYATDKEVISLICL